MPPAPLACAPVGALLLVVSLRAVPMVVLLVVSPC